MPPVLHHDRAGDFRFFGGRVGDKPGMIFAFGNLRGAGFAGHIDPLDLRG